VCPIEGSCCGNFAAACSHLVARRGRCWDYFGCCGRNFGLFALAVGCGCVVRDAQRSCARSAAARRPIAALMAAVAMVLLLVGILGTLWSVRRVKFPVH
jgi:hypothetical protein